MKKILMIIIVIVSIPIMIVNFFYSYNVQSVITGYIKNKDKDINIRVLKEDNSVEVMNMEEYLLGVVASEVPVYFEEEALKAQAVAARTYAMKQIENSNKEYDVTTTTSSQVYKTKEELQKQWGSKFDEYIKKIKSAVNSTRGQYITYNNEIIYSFFFSTSNGYTEDNKYVFGQDLPYLKTVDSSFDENETNNFTVEKDFNINEFYDKLQMNYNNIVNIENIKRTESNRVLSLCVNDKEFNGREFQKKLGLRSNDFEIKQNGNNINIVTKGFGHGVGMSQYGANALAKQRKNYVEILKYYYKDVDIQKL